MLGVDVMLRFILCLCRPIIRVVRPILQNVGIIIVMLIMFVEFIVQKWIYLKPTTELSRLLLTDVMHPQGNIILTVTEVVVAEILTE